MYLPSAVLRSWLESANLFKQGDLLLVSGETGVGKGRGELFRRAAEVFSADFASWKHTGDNLVSDFEAPKQLGISAFADHDAHLSARERLLRGDSLFANPRRSQLAGAARLARIDIPNNLEERARVLWRIGTAVAGPLFWGYTEWCLKEAEKRGIDDLYFLARGGQIFYRIALAIQAHRPVPIKLHYLHSSRLAFSGVADAEDGAYLRKLVSAPLPYHSFRQALANVGVGETSDISPPGLQKNEWGRNLTNSERSAVANWLLSPAMLPHIHSALAERRRLARAYLKQVGLTPSRKIGLVDTGWMGTIQRNIEFLLGTEGQPAEVTGFYLGLSKVREFSCAGEMMAYTNTFEALPLRRETTHLIMLELMARGTHGPLLGFVEQNGEVLPRFGPATDEANSDTRIFQEAVLAFVNRMHDAGSGIGISDGEFAQVAIGAYREFFRHPTLEEALVMGRTPHANQMLEESHTELCPDMSLGQILSGIASFRNRPPGWWLHGQATQGHSTLIHTYLALKRAKWWIQTAIFGQSD
jgi:hypothetical protein